MIPWWSLGALAATIDGRALERGNNEPVAGVELQIDGRVWVSDEKGRFSLDLPEGPVVIEVRHPDFLPQTLTLNNPPKKRLRIWLRPEPNPYEVVVESFRPTANTSRHHLDAEMALETPGTLDDPVRLVQALPSVAVQREYGPTAGDLSVRGSSPGDNRYYLDGIEVPYLYHYNQYSSVFPTSQIASLELYSSTFGAEYGDSIGAVVEATSRREAPKQFHGSIHANTLMVGADIRGPIRKGWWFSAAGRRSYQDLSSPNSAQYSLWPVFQDFSLRAQHGETAIFSWGASDSYARAAGDVDGLDPVETLETPSFRWRRGFSGIGADHRWSHGKFVAAILRDRARGELSNLGRQDQLTHALSTRLDVETHRNNPWNAAFGIEARLENTRLTVEPAGSLGRLVAEESPALARGTAIDASAWRARGAGYGELRLKFGNVRLFPGLRVPFDSATGELAPEPRFAIRWRAGDQTELKFSAGLYQQAPETDLLLRGDSWVTPDRRLGPTQSWQATVGVEQTIAGRLELGLDGWFKRIDHAIESLPGEEPSVLPTVYGYGGEAVARYRLRELFFVRSWVGLGRIGSTEDGLWTPLPGDQPVNVGLLGSWDPGKNWNLGLRYRFGAGLPYTPLEGSVYNATEDSWVPIAGDVRSERYTGYHKVDIHTSKQFLFRRWKLTFTAELGFVPKSSAQLYPVWNYDFQEQGWVTGPILLPLVSARAEF